MELVFRAVQERDRAQVFELFQQLGPRYQFDRDSDVARQLFAEYVAGQGKVGFVAEDVTAGCVAGVILLDVAKVFSPTMRHLRGDGMVVRASYRGLKISSQLLRMTFEFADSHGITSFMAKASDPTVISMYRSNSSLVERGVYFYRDSPVLSRSGDLASGIARR